MKNRPCGPPQRFFSKILSLFPQRMDFSWKKKIFFKYDFRCSFLRWFRICYSFRYWDWLWWRKPSKIDPIFYSFICFCYHQLKKFGFLDNYTKFKDTSIDTFEANTSAILYEIKHFTPPLFMNKSTDIYESILWGIRKLLVLDRIASVWFIFHLMKQGFYTQFFMLITNLKSHFRFE